MTVTSASKAWNIAGLKCAQVVMTNHADTARWRRLPVFAVPGPTPLGITASTAAYRNGQAWLQDLVAYLDGNRRLLEQLLEAELPEVAYRAPEGTYLAWLDCAGSASTIRPTSSSGRPGSRCSDGPPFGLGWEQHVRLNFATSTCAARADRHGPGLGRPHPPLNRARAGRRVPRLRAGAGGGRGGGAGLAPTTLLADRILAWARYSPACFTAAWYVLRSHTPVGRRRPGRSGPWPADPTPG